MGQASDGRTSIRQIYIGNLRDWQKVLLKPVPRKHGSCEGAKDEHFYPWSAKAGTQDL